VISNIVGWSEGVIFSNRRQRGSDGKGNDLQAKDANGRRCRKTV